MENKKLIRILRNFHFIVLVITNQSINSPEWFKQKNCKRRYLA